MTRVLFVCTHNSARSQMAEGLLRRAGGDRFDVHSAGTEAGTLHPLAVEAMEEVGIDISARAAKSIDRYLDQPFDLVITVCDDARESCPVFPDASRQLHWSLPDPARVTGTQDERLTAFRGVRDRLRDLIGTLVAQAK